MCIRDRATIYRLLRDYADAGGAVLVVSSDVAEIIGLCDRICVMALGRIAAWLPRGASEEAIVAQAVRHDLGEREEEAAEAAEVAA